MNQRPGGVKTTPRPAPQTTYSPKGGRSVGAPTNTTLLNAPKGFWILFAVTILLLISMLLTMTVLLLADQPASLPREDDSPSEQKDKPSSQSVTPGVSGTKPSPTQPKRLTDFCSGIVS